MTKQNDIVLVPNDWIPLNALILLSENNGGRLMGGQSEFYTDDLSRDGGIYYINPNGYLIHEELDMQVIHGDPKLNKGNTSLVINTTHRPILEHNLKKLYSQILNKVCILVLRFKEHKVIEVQSIIRSCTQ
jgi:hypothetical protein